MSICPPDLFFEISQMPLHTIIEIQMGVTGVQEKRYKLMETQSKFFSTTPMNNHLQKSVDQCHSVSRTLCSPLKVAVFNF
jgi:hypothetical protein